MVLVSAVLAAFALALAWPVPLALARADWPSRAPAAALALWQAIALGGGVAMIGCLLAFGASPAGSLGAAVAELLPHLLAGSLPTGYTLVHIGSLAFAIGLAVHLALNLALTVGRAERERRRQHQLIALLGDPMPGSPTTRILPHPVPLAYCVPGVRTATVLTDGLVAALDERQLAAVVAHERAHLDQFHHVVLVAFRAWHGALPWFPIANRAERAVTQLTEMLADDRARRAVDDESLASALARLGSAGEPGAYEDSGGIAPDRDMLAARLARLGGAPSREASDRPWQATRIVLALAVAVAALPVVALAAIR